MSKLREEIRFQRKAFPKSTYSLVDEKGECYCRTIDGADIFADLIEQMGFMDKEIAYSVIDTDANVTFYLGVGEV